VKEQTVSGSVGHCDVPRFIRTYNNREFDEDDCRTLLFGEERLTKCQREKNKGRSLILVDYGPDLRMRHVQIAY
jgi:hypothetical protein